LTSINLEQLAIAKILNEADSELFLSVNAGLFSGSAKVAYNTIAKQFKSGELPTVSTVLMSVSENSQVAEWCNQYKDTDIDTDILIQELNNNKARDSMLDYMLEIADAVPSMTADQLVDTSINLTNSLVHCAPITDDSVVSLLDVDIEEQQTNIYSSGMCQHFDFKDGGFADGELILMGGVRGSGKSVISQNLLIHHYTNHKRSVLFGNIEMSPSNLNRRFLSSISQVPFSMLKLNMSEQEKLSVMKAKARFLYKNNELLEDVLRESKTLQEMNGALKSECEANEHQLQIVNDGGLSLPKLEQHIMKLADVSDVGLVVVDYIGIIKGETKGEADWLEIQRKAERLKEIALRYDLIMITPNQIHTDGSSKRAKSVEDPCDRSFKFFPKLNEQGIQGPIIDVYQAKSRDGEAFPFTMKMDWQTMTLDPNHEGKANQDMEDRAGVRAA